MKTFVLTLYFILIAAVIADILMTAADKTGGGKNYE